MNIITSLLDIEDNDLELLSCEVQGLKKIVTLGSMPTPHFCPQYFYKMHSRGIKTRTINLPVLQDGYQLIIKLRQRRWRCTNTDCLYESNEHFKLVNRYRRKLLNYMVFAHREMNRIYKDYWIYPIKGALLPVIDILQYLIYNIGDEAFTTIKTIDIFYLFRYLPCCKTSCVHRDYLLIYFRDVFLSLLNNLWLKGAVSILRCF